MNNKIKKLKNIKFGMKIGMALLGCVVTVGALCIDYKIDQLRGIKPKR